MPSTRAVSSASWTGGPPGASTADWRRPSPGTASTRAGGGGSSRATTWSIGRARGPEADGRRAGRATLREYLAAPFRHDGRLHRPLLCLCLLVHLVLLFNAVFHDPWIGYDGEAHVQYIEALAKLRLPAMEDTPEWYSPPLPYLLPALWRAAGFSLTSAAKAAQLLNVVYSLLLFEFLLRICDQLRPGAI